MSGNNKKEDKTNKSNGANSEPSRTENASVANVTSPLSPDGAGAKNGDLANPRKIEGKVQTVTENRTVNPYSEMRAKANVPTKEEMFWRAMNEGFDKREADIKEKQKRSERISAISDAISALANMHFTAQGAPNMYDPKNTMSEASRVRYDRMMADFQKDKENRLNWWRTKREDDYKRAKEEAAEKRSIAKEMREVEREKVEDDRWNKLFNQKEQERQDRLAREQREEEQRNKEFEEKKKQNKEQNRIDWARVNNSGGKGGTSGGSKEEKPGEYPWWDADGNLHYAHSYDAMRQNAINAGTWVNSEQKTVTTKTGITGVETTEKTEPGKGYSKKTEKSADGGKGNEFDEFRRK